MAPVPEEPTDLRFVGPATATVFEAAPFSAGDVAARRVSFRDLVDAGIDPEVADRLRGAYSLVWSFEWRVGGDDLPWRADLIRGLGDEERTWIAESASGNGDGTVVPTDDRPSTALGASPDSACPRCEGTLASFVLGDRATVQCRQCGYVDVERR